MKLRRIIAAAAVLAMLFTMTPAYAGGSVVISSVEPSENSSIELRENEKITFSCNVSGASLVKFLLDGVVVTEFSRNGECTYEMDSGKVGVGNRSFEVVALDKYGNISIERSRFSTFVNLKSPINEGASSEVQTFDAMGEEYSERTIDETLISNFSRDFGWTLTGKDVYLQRVAGVSGQADDYAVSIIPYGTAGNSNARFKFDGWKDEVKTGKIIIEFDWKISAPQQMGTNIKLYGLPLAESDVIKEDGKTMYDTGFEPQSMVWVHMKYDYDVDENKCSLWIDGKQYWDEKECGVKNSENNLSQFVFVPQYWSAANYFTKNYWAFITIDNFSIYKKAKKSTLDSLSYLKGGEMVSVSDKVPYGSEKIVASFSEELNESTAENLEMFIDGVKRENVKAEVSGNILSVDLPPDIMNCEVCVRSADGFEVFSSDASFCGINFGFSVDGKIEAKVEYRVNSVEAQSKALLKKDDVVTASYTANNIGDGSQKLLLLLTLRKNGSLSMISCSEVNLAANTKDTFELPHLTVAEDGEYEIGLTVLGSFRDTKQY